MWFLDFNLVCFLHLLYLVLFSLWVISVLFSIFFSQISKRCSCIILTSALCFPSLLVGSCGVYFFVFISNVSTVGVLTIFIKISSPLLLTDVRTLGILTKKCSCPYLCNFHHSSFFFKGTTYLVNHKYSSQLGRQKFIHSFLSSYESKWQSNLTNFSRQKAQDSFITFAFLITHI